MENKEIEIQEDNPFKNDVLKREIIAENLEQIIDSAHGSMVLSIDARWGNGKTTFIKMWKKRIDGAKKYETIYFNAWENDDSEDPLLSLIGEIEGNLNKNKGKYDEMLEKIKEYGAPLLKKAVSTVIKVETVGMVDVENLLTPKEDLSKFGQYKKEKEARTEFKTALEEYQKTKKKKIIFFIDELDRCRPTFAIETLEKIKHLFNIDDFIFILSLDKQQLSYSIKTLYGQEMDAVGYLRRFIDLEFILPEPQREDYIEFLLERHNIKNDNTAYFTTYLKHFINFYKLSLRDIDKLFNYLELIIPSVFPNILDHNSGLLKLETFGVIYALFPVLKIKDVELYKKFVNRECVTNTDKAKIINATPINGESSKISFSGDTKVRKNYYQMIIQNIIVLNNKLKSDVKRSDMHPSYVEAIGRPRFDLNELLDENEKTFKFIGQLEFVDSFVVPE